MGDLLIHARFHIINREGLPERVIEFCDHVRRHFGRGLYAVKANHLEILHARFRHRRYTRTG